MLHKIACQSDRLKGKHDLCHRSIMLHMWIKHIRTTSNVRKLNIRFKLSKTKLVMVAAC